MSNMRAKFTLQKIEQHAVSGSDECLCNVEFAAVAADSEDNKDWSQWTPSGKIEMTITNPEAMKGLEVGKAYFIDFTPAI